MIKSIQLYLTDFASELKLFGLQFVVVFPCPHKFLKLLSINNFNKRA